MNFHFEYDDKMFEKKKNYTTKKYIMSNKMYDKLDYAKKDYFDALMSSANQDIKIPKDWMDKIRIREYFDEYDSDEYDDSIDSESKEANDALMKETLRQLEEARRKEEAEEARRQKAKEEAKRKAAEAKAKAEEEAQTEAAISQLVDAFQGKT